MIGNKHTPGPWAVSEVVPKAITVDGDTRNLLGLRDFGDGEGDYAIVMKQADAELMASAPDMRAELDRTTAAVLSGGPFCRHCPRHNGKHNDDCPVPDAHKIRVKYGFDKKEQP